VQISAIRCKRKRIAQGALGVARPPDPVVRQRQRTRMIRGGRRQRIRASAGIERLLALAGSPEQFRQFTIGLGAIRAQFERSA
jgi:hypothetical protein